MRNSGNDVKSVMCYHQIAFSGDFLFPPRKNTLDTSRFIKVVDHRNDCQNVELPAKTHFEGLIFGGTYVQREI